MRLLYRLLLGLCLLLSFTSAQADQTPRWKMAFPKEVNWMKLTSAGILVVNTDDALYGVNPENGSILWQHEEFKKLPQDFVDVIDNTQFIAVTMKKLRVNVVLMDVTDGKKLWTTKELDLASVMGIMIVPDNLSLLICGGNLKGKAVYMMVELATGNEIWMKEQWLGKGANAQWPTTFPARDDKPNGTKRTLRGNQPLLFLDENRFIASLGPDQLGLYDARTGDKIWEVDPKILKAEMAPAIKLGYSPFILSADKSILYAPFGKNLLAVRVADGSLVWPKPPKIKGIPTQLELSSAGLIVRTIGEKANIQVLDYATGEPVWKKPFKDMGQCSPFIVQGDKVYLYSNDGGGAGVAGFAASRLGTGLGGGFVGSIAGQAAKAAASEKDAGQLFEINLATGENRELVKKVFLHGDTPISLEYRDGGLLLVSPQCIYAYNMDGTIRFETYLPAPGSSAAALIASTAANALASEMSYQSAWNNAYNNPGRAYKYEIITDNPVMSRRFGLREKSDFFAYVNTKKAGDEKGEKAFGIVQVDKRDGKELKRIVLNERDPEIEIDEIEQLVYHMSDKKEITCYGF